MQDETLEKIIRDVLKSMSEKIDNKREEKYSDICNVTYKDYPLAQKRKDLVKTLTGKGLDDITLDAVLNDKITPDDIRITSDTLLYQAQVAESPFTLR